jgi:hypothetical protein
MASLLQGTEDNLDMPIESMIGTCRWREGREGGREQNRGFSSLHSCEGLGKGVWVPQLVCVKGVRLSLCVWRRLLKGWMCACMYVVVGGTWSLTPVRGGGCFGNTMINDDMSSPSLPLTTPLPPSLPPSLPAPAEDNNEAGTAAEGAAPSNPNNRRVYVGNLSWSTAWQGLKDHMKTVGEGE